MKVLIPIRRFKPARLFVFTVVGILLGVPVGYLGCFLFIFLGDLLNSGLGAAVRGAEEIVQYGLSYYLEEPMASISVSLGSFFGGLLGLSYYGLLRHRKIAADLINPDNA